MSKHDDDTCPHLVRVSLLEAENVRLKAEVERLRVAGEDLAHAVRTKHGVDFALEEWDKEAKKGGQP